MFIERNPWVIVIGSVLTAATAYFSVVFVNQIDWSDLLGNWFILAIVFMCFATIALAVYRSLRRSRNPTAMDEAKTRRNY
jgi:hypothetical protein